jgi:hypothetical protein
VDEPSAGVRHVRQFAVADHASPAHAAAAYLDTLGAGRAAPQRAALAVATAIDGAPISDVKLAYSRLIQSCNACHAATDHGFILITEARGESGWNQAF